MTRAFSEITGLVTLDLGDNKFTGGIPNWIGDLSSLSILILKGNHIEGIIPKELCKLSTLSIIDLSRNSLSGPIPHCLSNIAFEKNFAKSDSFGYRFYLYDLIARLGSELNLKSGSSSYLDLKVNIQLVALVDESVKITTKRISYSYNSNILNLMSDMDLSCNKLSGEIPRVGSLVEILALNFSHNSLTGRIPPTLSMLNNIESLDLSNNKLRGRIPSQLVELTTLKIFSVANNNLSGRTPDRKGQFGTFDKRSYEGNPLLYVPPLLNNCGKGIESPLERPNETHNEEDDGLIDMHDFYITFGVTYIIAFFGVVIVLYINPYWRRTCFYYFETCVTTCYYFILDNLHRMVLRRIR